jgi:hypothetical protein
MSKLVTSSIQHPSSTVANLVLNADGTVDGPGINADNVVKAIYFEQMTVAQTFTGTSSDFTDLTGLSITLTPKSDASKFLVESCVYIANSFSTYRTLNKARVLRDSTVIQDTLSGFSFSDETFVLTPVFVTVLDSPNTTSPITYKTQATQAVTGSSITMYINRREDGSSIVAASFLKITEFG